MSSSPLLACLGTIACILLLNLAFFTNAQLATPQTWVKPGGCDIATCGSTCNGSFECPLPNIQAGLNALGSGGGNVVLYAGTYEGEGNSNITLSGSQYIISAGQGIQSSIIECGGRPGFTITNGGANFIGLVVNNCLRADGNGGAFFVRFGSIRLDVVKVTNSRAILGGALYLASGTAEAYRTYLTNNTATQTGGGAYITNGRFSITESNTSGNQPNDIACSGADVQVFRPIATGQAQCGVGCSSSLCNAAP